MPQQPTTALPPTPTPPLFLLVVLGAGLAWAYWPVLHGMEQKWAADPQYSHGYLVPAFALVLLWRRGFLRVSPCPAWWGMGFFVVGAVLRLAGAWWYTDWLQAFSLLVCLAGATVLYGGGPALRAAWPAVAFLVFMIPLPYRLETALCQPLQSLMSEAGALVLQTLGRPAVAEGNVLLLGELRLEVARACSGLGTLVVFFAIATGLVLLTERPLADRVVLVASAAPIALVVNVVRIALTALLAEAAGSQGTVDAMHELAGWFMILLALALFWLESWALGALLVAPSLEGSRRPEHKPQAPARGGPRAGAWGLCRPRAGAWGLSLALVVLQGVVSGLWTGRWGESDELRAAVARLEDVPLSAGPWQGEALDEELRHRDAAEIAGYLLRRYTRRPGGPAVSLLIVCGRPGPIAVHSPEVCYRGAGYDLRGEPVRFRVGAGAAAGWFWVADFEKRGAVVPSFLRIFWAWNDGSGWQAADDPRLEFARSHALYKMYVVQEMVAPDEPLETDPAVAFLDRMLPSLTHH